MSRLGNRSAAIGAIGILIGVAGVQAETTSGISALNGYDVGMLPHELAEKLKPYGDFGKYPHLSWSVKYPKAEWRVETNANEKGEVPGLHTITYGSGEITVPYCLGAMKKELPGLLDKVSIRSPLTGYIGVTDKVHPQVAVFVAEAHLRLADSNELARVLPVLAMAYARCGETNLLRKLVSGENLIPPMRGGKFIPPLKEDIIEYRTGSGPGDYWHNHQTALLKGDMERAGKELVLLKKAGSAESGRIGGLEQKLSAIRKDKARKAEANALKKEIGTRKKGLKAYEGILPRAQARLDRFGKGILNGLPAESLAQWREQGRRWSFLREKTSLKYLESLETGKVVELVNSWASSAGHINPLLSELVCYLIEQRRYAGTDLEMGTLVWSGIYLHAKGHGARSIPVFALAQRTGALRPEKGNARFFGVESGMYLGRIITEDDKLIRIKELIPAFCHIVKHSMLWCSEGVGRFGYGPNGTMVQKAGKKPDGWIFKFYSNLGRQYAHLLAWGEDRDRSVRELAWLEREGLLPRVRNAARNRAGQLYGSAGDNEKALQAYEAALIKAENGAGISEACWHMMSLGYEKKDPVVWKRISHALGQVMKREIVRKDEDMMVVVKNSQSLAEGRTGM